ncbi:MAG: putative toxin-antitoxin system toxin component, PIN family [Phormidesmis sp.]
MVDKIEIDTSVFISALIGPTGPSRELIRQCLQGKYQPLMGNTLFCEYEAASTRQRILERCVLSASEIETLLGAVMSISQWTFIYYTWRPNLKDKADNHLIELAIAGNASIIATNNLKDFNNTELLFPQLTIIKPEELLRRT